MSSPCPRCGYDLSGIMATWSDSCPLDGTCTECGLDFAWGRILELAEHPWLFEYHWRRKPFRRLARTWYEALRPRRFWTAVQLSDPVHLRPLALVVSGLLVAAVAGGYGFILSYSYPWFRQAIQMWGTRGGGPAGARSWSDFFVSGAQELLYEAAIRAPGLLTAMLATPLLFVLLPQTLGRAKVRPAHIARIWLYSLLLPLTAFAVWGVLEVLLARSGLWGAALVLNPWHWVYKVVTGGPFLDWIAGAMPGYGLAVLYTVWGGYWSWCGCKLYLKIEEPGRVALAFSVIVLLAATLVQLSVWIIAF